ncbi:MAG: GNAT family N-acetyltransferase [Nocardioides sp.]
MGGTASNAQVRPMTAADIEEVEQLTAAAYAPTGADSWRRPPAEAERWQQRAAHLLRTDPRGCWVIETGHELLGCVASVRRERTWVLSSFGVRPDLRGRGLGKALLAMALDYGRGCLRGLLLSSAHPAATRIYRQAGFTLHPLMRLSGMVDRATLPIDDPVREATVRESDLLDSIDRRTRSAAHGADHEFLARHHRLLVCDRPNGSGYAYLDTDGSPVLLAATNRRTARAVLWRALIDAPGPVTIPQVTAENQWALDVGMAAGLALEIQPGFLGIRQGRPPMPYLPHRALL